MMTEQAVNTVRQEERAQQECSLLEGSRPCWEEIPLEKVTEDLVKWQTCDSRTKQL